MELICIVCPNGCRLEITGEAENLEVTGQQCKKGLDFAVAEITAPMRSLSSTVATVFPEMPRLPVKTREEIPKGALLEAMAKIRAVVVREPKKVGDIVLAGVFGTDIVATGELAL